VLAGQTTLEFDAGFGVLPALLRELNIPVNSQTLVFSKTSLQSAAITPQTPRALYFNDSTYVGFVPNGGLIEIATVDPQFGVVFYTLNRTPGARPSLVRNADCAQCHVTPATFGLPGLFLRSVFAKVDGQVSSRLGGFVTDQNSPINERWGGWFVTGTIPLEHMGNAFLRGGDEEPSLMRDASTAATLLAQFDRTRYLSPHSDVVALLVLDHQVHMHNLMGRLRYDVAQGLSLTDDVASLVRYALFADEASLRGPIAGVSGFAAAFEGHGPHDASGRSLRQFDLQTRLFRYPCSYLLYSEEFAGLPDQAKIAVIRRIDAVLTGRDGDGEFTRLSVADRAAIRSILIETLPVFGEQTAR
jgi:hypothetical protein